MEITLNRGLNASHANFSAFFSPHPITTVKVKEYVRRWFQNEMNDLQLEILDRRILRTIRLDSNYNEIEAKAIKGNVDPLLTKIAETCSQLIVSPKSPWNPEVQLKSDRQYLIYNLLRGKPLSLEQIKKDPALIPAVLWDLNLEMLGEARDLIQSLLKDIHRQMSNPKLKESDLFHLEAIMGDLLALYPFLKPEADEIVQLPVKIEGVWELVDYTTDRIELSSDLLSSPLVAYGFCPSISSAPPILLFKGTTYPSDEGALMSLLVDITPFTSVGELGFFIGQTKIQDWINNQTSNAQIITIGKSLGAIQALRTALYFPEKIGKVMAYGSPGFSPLELKKLHEVKEKYPDLQMNLFCQRNDLVPFSDCVADEQYVNYFEVLSDNCEENPLKAHADMFLTHERSVILRMQPWHIQSIWKRAAVTIPRLTATLASPIVAGGVLLNGTVRTIKYLGEEALRFFQFSESERPV